MSARHRKKKLKGRVLPQSVIEKDIPDDLPDLDPDANTEFTDAETLRLQAEADASIPEEGVLIEEYEFDDKKEKHEKDVSEMVMHGPTSFEEMDEMREARKNTEAVRQVLYDAELITSNILNSPVEPVEKATKLKTLADAFTSRVSKTIKTEKKEFDYDLAEAEMLLHQGGPTLSDKAIEILERAKLTGDSRGNLSDSDFALVKTEGEATVRKYPIHDVAHVRNALARAAQQIKAGGDGAADARAALPKIRAAARKLGIGSPSKKNDNSLVVLKDKDGNYRWFGWVSNNFKDRDGQIITDEAHKEYVGWLDKNPQFAPTFRIWHTKGTDREKQADWWDYDHGFLMMSGPLTEKEAVALMGVAAKEKLGMSHGFYGTVKDEKYITWYRSFEVSDLPSTKASNPWTPIGVIEKEKEMDKLKADYIGAQLGDDFVKTVEADAEKAQAELREAGVEEKEVKGATTVVNNTVVEPKMDELMKAIGEQLGMEQLSAWVKEAQTALAKVPALEAEIKELKKSTDEKVAEAITPPAAKHHYSWLKRESENAENIVKEGDEEDAELEKSAGDDKGWFAQVAAVPSLANGQ